MFSSVCFSINIYSRRYLFSMFIYEQAYLDDKYNYQISLDVDYLQPDFCRSVFPAS